MIRGAVSFEMIVNRLWQRDSVSDGRIFRPDYPAAISAGDDRHWNAAASDFSLPNFQARKNPKQKLRVFNSAVENYLVLLICGVLLLSSRIRLCGCRSGLVGVAQLLVFFNCAGWLGSRSCSLSRLRRLVRAGFRSCSSTVLSRCAERQERDGSGGQKKLLHDSFQIWLLILPG